MAKGAFLVTPEDHPNAIPYQASEAKNWLNLELANIAKHSKRQVVVIIEILEM